MAKYRKHNWQKYFKEFEQANLTQTEFYKLHDLNSKHFSQKLAQHKASNNTAFAKVSITPEVGRSWDRHPYAIEIIIYQPK